VLNLIFGFCLYYVYFYSGEGEVVRRKGLLASMKSQNDRLEDELNGSGNNSRGALMGGARRTPINLSEESQESQQISNQQLQSQQRTALSEQDSKLDGILDGVSRLKVMSSDINAELDLHQNLLGELDTAVDATDARLQRNTKRIEIVSEKAGGCCGLITMVILFALIVILLATNWGCHVFKPSKC
jgi:ribosome assembly protein YihI (activator of Der GTPase)